MGNMNHIAAATFVQISREELEDWLNSSGYRGKWERDARSAGLYLIKLSDNVAVKLSSTIGSKDDAMGRGKASMQLSLVSTVTGRVLNKKAQGQDHFKRTTGWMKTWAAGIETMKRAYLSSSDFYDVIAGIVDRDAYKDELLAKIKNVPDWGNNPDLVGYYRKIERGGVLMPREQNSLENLLTQPVSVERPAPEPRRPEPRPEPAQRSLPNLDAKNTQDLRMDALRKLWVVARRRDDNWTMGFAQDIAQKYIAQDRPISVPQRRIILEKLKSYGVQDLNGKPAYELF